LTLEIPEIKSPLEGNIPLLGRPQRGWFKENRDGCKNGIQVGFWREEKVIQREED
jgi:hypothetical protein